MHRYVQGEISVIVGDMKNITMTSFHLGYATS